MKMESDSEITEENFTDSEEFQENLTSEASNIIASSNTTESGVIEEDPHAKAIKEYEDKLLAEISSLETILRGERSNLARIKDKVSESGKAGFFMIQAQVNDFLVSIAITA